MVGSLALPARMHHLPWGFLTKIPMDQSILMISIGAIGLGVSIWRLPPPRSKLDVDQAITQFRSKTPDLTYHAEQKLYYCPQTGTVTSDKHVETKAKRLTLLRSDDGSYYAKTPRKLGKGVQKTAYVAINIQTGVADQALTIERNPPVNDELAIYEALKDCPYVVHRLAVVKNTPKKRSLILEMCPTTLEKAVGLTQAQLLSLYEEYLRGLAALHEVGYLHLDCHKGNLFIDTEGHGRLGDFGSSRPIDSLNTKEGFGKMMPIETAGGRSLPLAMAVALLAPEIVLGIGHHQEEKDVTQPPLISGKADVWAIGNSLASLLRPKAEAYQALTTVQHQLQPQKETFQPFALKLGEHNIYYSKLTDTYPAQPTQQLSLDLLILKMLHPDPNQCFTALEAADYISHLRKIRQDP